MSADEFELALRKSLQRLILSKNRKNEPWLYFAEDFNIDRQMLHKIRTLQANPTFTTIAKICEDLSVEPILTFKPIKEDKK